MYRIKNTNNPLERSSPKNFPPGRIKIADALRFLMEKKEFGAITTREIAKTAGVNEALIYRYFKDKRGLLHEVLKEYLEPFVAQMRAETKNIRGARNKLKKMIHISFDLYSKNRVFAKILLLEVRNYPRYFESTTYELVKEYADLIVRSVEEGIKNGEIREDVQPSFIRQLILGSIEHFILPRILFNLDFSVDIFTDNLCKLAFRGMEPEGVEAQAPQVKPSN